MLLSNETFASYVKENFVASWEEVRPVPKVTIDFGNGETLERTIAGNTVMYVVEPDGSVLDAYPGVYLAEDLLPQLEGVIAYREHVNKDSSLVPGEAFSAWHRARLATESLGDSMTFSKAMPEAPLLKALDLEYKETPPSGAGEIARRARDISKTADGDKVARELAGSDDPGAVVAADSKVNIRDIRPIIRAILAQEDLDHTVESLTRPLYIDVLDINIDDPYLGLAGPGIPGTPRPGGE